MHDICISQLLPSSVDPFSVHMFVIYTTPPQWLAWCSIRILFLEDLITLNLQWQCYRLAHLCSWRGRVKWRDYNKPPRGFSDSGRVVRGSHRRLAWVLPPSVLSDFFSSVSSLLPLLSSSYFRFYFFFVLLVFVSQRSPSRRPVLSCLPWPFDPQSPFGLLSARLMAASELPLPRRRKHFYHLKLIFWRASLDGVVCSKRFMTQGQWRVGAEGSAQNREAATTSADGQFLWV